MTGYIDTEHVRHIEQLTDDNSIGAVTLDDSGIEVGDGVTIDLYRLREAIILAEQNDIDPSKATVSLLHREDEDQAPAIIIRHSRTARKGIALAGKQPADKGADE